MMKSAKLFLIAFFGVYLVGSIALNALLGPPGFSKSYLAGHKAEHERYIGISKSDEYKRYLERPHLNPPPPALVEDFGFADEYASTDAYRAELRRRGIYELLFDLFRVGMVALLVARFARKPLAAFLDEQIENVRERTAKTDHDTQLADARLASAEQKKREIEAEREALYADARERARLESLRIEEMTAQAMARLKTEEADRLNHERLLVRRAMKKELVEEASRILVERYEASRSDRSEAPLLARFIEQMERTR